MLHKDISGLSMIKRSVSIFILLMTGFRHTYDNQYVPVNSGARTNRIIIVSDAVWVYFNLDNLLPIRTYIFDPVAYVEAMKRMKTLVTQPDHIIPGHDDQVFPGFPEVCKGIVKIGN